MKPRFALHRLDSCSRHSAAIGVQNSALDLAAPDGLRVNHRASGKRVYTQHDKEQAKAESRRSWKFVGKVQLGPIGKHREASDSFVREVYTSDKVDCQTIPALRTSWLAVVDGGGFGLRALERDAQSFFQRRSARLSQISSARP
jgi:hypothetical protein